MPRVPDLPIWLLRLLVVLGVSTAGLERVDMLAGDGPLRLSPFLVLAPVLVLAALIVRLRPEAAVSTSTFQRPAGWLLFLFLWLTVLSVTFSTTHISTGRALLLVVDAIAAWSIFVIARDTRVRDALWQGAAVGLAMYAIFDAVLLYRFMELGPLALSDTPGMVNMRVSPLGEGIARLAGASLDANRAAFVVATYCYILVADPVIRRFWRPLPVVSVVLLGLGLVAVTASRSGLGAYLIMFVGVLAVMFWKSRRRAKLIALGLSAAAVVAALAALSSERGAIVAEAIQRRLSPTDGSTSAHFDLIERGLASLGETPLQPWLGMGYGSGFTLLQDVFPDNTYANFHSVYVTILVEVGVFGLLAFAALCLLPLLTPRRWLALGILVFSVFYQSLADPIFWLALALLWVAPPEEGATTTHLRRRTTSVDTGQVLDRSDTLSITPTAP